MTSSKAWLWVALLLTLPCATSLAQQTAKAKHGMVVSVSRPASEVGVQVLKDGGNAVDATIATALALTVAWPEAGNIGGGGFMLVHRGAGQPPVVIDYRELAPAAANREMFARERGSQYRLVGVPGTVRGLELAHQKFGKLPWQRLVAPAIALADDGIEVNESLARSLNEGLRNSDEFPELRQVFAPPAGRDRWRAGDKLVQPELAKTLRLIAEHGARGFYEGEVAAALAKEVQRGGGIITKEDLRAYEAKIRTPIHGTYRGYDIYAPPPPSSGGIALVEMLNIVERFDLKQEPRESPRTLHVMIEAMKRAYADRARHLGDADFVEIPKTLTSKDYAAELAKSISLQKATPSAAVAPEIELADESENTTHFSVVDSDGMAVSNTYTLEQSFGSRIVVPGYGFLLNNEMGDFNPVPGQTTRAGQIGTAANEVRPHKRMLSSMCPTIVCRDGKPVLVTGSPGGRTIINTVFCVLVNRLEYDMPLEHAVEFPRLHHQWLPDEARWESRRRRDSLAITTAALGLIGQKVVLRIGHQGDAHSIGIDPKTGEIEGVADTRRDGWAAGY